MPPDWILPTAAERCQRCCHIYAAPLRAAPLPLMPRFRYFHATPAATASQPPLRHFRLIAVSPPFHDAITLFSASQLIFRHPEYHWPLRRHFAIFGCRIRHDSQHYGCPALRHSHWPWLPLSRFSPYFRQMRQLSRFR